MSFINSC